MYPERSLLLPMLLALGGCLSAPAIDDVVPAVEPDLESSPDSGIADEASGETETAEPSEASVPDTEPVEDAGLTDTTVVDETKDTSVIIPVADTKVEDTKVTDTAVADTRVADTMTAADTRVVTDTAPTTVEDTRPTTSTTEYAPYFYSWGWGNSAYPFTSLVDMQKKAGVNGATLAFVLARSGTCEASRTVPSHLSDIKAFRAAGGLVKASFGGASGTYLESVCSTSTALANAIGAFVDETDLRDLDFDVEQGGVMNATVNARRAAALASVQATRGAKISFTLAVNPTGLTSEAYAVVKSAVAAGIVISHVNLMVMDYGSSLSSGRTMGALAISAIESTVKQLKTVMPGLSDAKAFAMIGATPMIGQNDVSTEVFTLADARTLADYALGKHLGLVSFWAIQRDQPCGSSATLDTCSVAGAPSYGFHGILKGVAP